MSRTSSLPTAWSGSGLRPVPQRSLTAEESSRLRPRRAVPTLELGGAVGALCTVALPPVGTQVWVAALVWIGWLLALAHAPRRPRPLRTHAPFPLRALAQAAAALVVGAAALAYVTPVELHPARVFGTVGAVVVCAAVAELVRRLGSRPALRVVVAGHHGEVGTVISELCRADTPDIEVTAVTVAETRQQVVASVARHRADALLITPCPHFDPAELRRTSWDLETIGAELLLHPGIIDVAAHRVATERWGALHVVHVAQRRAEGAWLVAKEAGERLAATVGLLLVLPVLLPVMLAIRLDSPGPAIFRQQRVGRDGTAFTMLKLRTMVADAEDRRTSLEACNEADGALFKMRADPRITRLGAFLRRFSLDELPQLVNVVRGEMALIGPRPALPSEVATYDGDALRRLAVKPGLTGLWQVSGRSDLSWSDSVRLDLDYVDNWSPAMDADILRRTARAVLGHSGAY